MAATAHKEQLGGYTHQEFVAALKRDCDHAWAVFDRELKPFAMQRLRKYEPDPHRCEDSWQEAIVTVWCKLTDYTGTEFRCLRAWTSKIARNKLLDEIRKSGKHPTQSLEQAILIEEGALYLEELLASSAATPEEEFIVKELVQKMSAFVRTHIGDSGRKWEIWCLMTQGTTSPQEIAAQIETSAGAVSVHKHELLKLIDMFWDQFGLEE